MDLQLEEVIRRFKEDAKSWKPTPVKQPKYWLWTAGVIALATVVLECVVELIEVLLGYQLWQALI